jgi:D-alanyl-D-alanine endopeptidase (penicillin-binding protein 7)
MTPPLSPVNVAAFALQVLVIVGAGALLLRAFRIDAPRAVLAYWRILLLACLTLPFVQPWTIVEVPVVTATAPDAVSSRPSLSEGLVTARPPAAAWRPAQGLLFVLALGIGARLIWLAIGAYGLLRLRRQSLPLDPLPDAIASARSRVPVDARFYVSDRIPGPITFGVIRPVIVLTPGIRAMPARVQEAIACHELLHVQRRDWLSEILEAFVVSVLWFHPAIWILIGRIRLAREQVVDEATIRLTDSREHYVESLLAVARARLFPSLSPVSPFLRRHLLKKRVARILQERTMTTRRLIVSLTASAAALAVAAAFAVRSFPLEAQERAVALSGEPIQVVKGAEHLLHGDRPEYPERAIEQQISGDVQVEMTLDQHGEVSDARVLSGPEELRKATLESVLQWHYSPAALASTTTYATLRFRVPPPLTEQEQKEKLEIESEHGAKLALAHHRLEEMEKAIADPTIGDEQRVELKVRLAKTRAELGEAFRHQGESVGFAGTSHGKEAGGFDGAPPLLQVKTERVSPEVAKEVLTDAGVSVGDPVTADTVKRVELAARKMDVHFTVEHKATEGGIVLMILAK